MSGGLDVTAKYSGLCLPPSYTRGGEKDNLALDPKARPTAQ
jgi:hypothetical protein